MPNAISNDTGVCDPCASIVPISIDHLLLVLLLVVCVLVGYCITHFKIPYLPESGAAMILGLVVGGCVRAAGGVHLERSAFSSLLFSYLLPPIIFEAGYSLKRANFFRNIGTILTFAVFGTLISAIIIGYFIFWFSQSGACTASDPCLDPVDPLESLIFGSVLSATDPVATLSILGNANADVHLYSTVFGEAVLNDAVAIVLFQSLLSFGGPASFSAGKLLEAVALFFGISFGSVGVGCVMALITAAILKKATHMHEHPVMESTVMLLLAYFTYCLCEVLSLSGLMALFFFGCTVAHYGYYSLSDVSKTSTGQTFHLLAFLSETIIYVYLGLSAVLDDSNTYSVGMIFYTLFMCFFSRACNVFPLCFILNRFRKNKMTFKTQVMIFFAGLRGAIAFALASTVLTSNNGVIVTTTMIIVVVTTLVQGAFTGPVLKCLGLQGSADEAVEFARGDIPTTTKMKAEKRSRVHRLWRSVDEKIMKPFFGGQAREALNDDAAAQSRQSLAMLTPNPEYSAPDGLVSGAEEAAAYASGARASSADNSRTQRESLEEHLLSA